jgi:hypothetical protein
VDSRLQSLSRTTNFAARFFSSGNVFFCVTCRHKRKKNSAVRVLLPTKRAKSAAFGPSDRAVGRVQVQVATAAVQQAHRKPQQAEIHSISTASRTETRAAIIGWRLLLQ